MSSIEDAKSWHNFVFLMHYSKLKDALPAGDTMANIIVRQLPPSDS